MKTSLYFIAAGLFLASAVPASAKTQVCILNITVTRSVNGKQVPARNAAVVLHGVNKNGQQERSGMEIKTDAEGHTSYPGVPYGRLRIQVIMPHYQTFGQDYVVNQPEQSVTIQLSRPKSQYSIYDDSEEPPATKNPPAAQKPSAPKDPPK